MSTSCRHRLEESRKSDAPLGRIASLLAASCVCAFAAPLAAQCTQQSLPSDGMPGTNGVVRAATLWDPPGPVTTQTVFGGAFTLAGTVAANRIVAIDRSRASGRRWGAV